MASELRWYKGNLHMHSYWSDGRGFPEMIARWFKDHGYHFIAFTEHNQLQSGQRWVDAGPGSHAATARTAGSLREQYLAGFGEGIVEERVTEAASEVRLKPLYEYRHLFEEAGKFLMLTGEEIDTDSSERRNWINVINLAEAIAPLPRQEGVVEAMSALVRAVDAAALASGRPLLTYLNHPNYLWNATAEEIAATQGLRFVEIHTALNSVLTYGDETHIGAEQIWDVALALRFSRPQPEMLYGLANDDCHGYPFEIPEAQGNHPGRAWMMVRAGRLTPEGIIKAMLRGDFYCSTGVTLRSLASGDRYLELAIDAQEDTRYTIRFIGTRRGVDLTGTPQVDEAGKPIHTTYQYPQGIGVVLAEVQGLEARYNFGGDELYVRAVVISDRPHPNPSVPGDVMKAWTQPIPNRDFVQFD